VCLALLDRAVLGKEEFGHDRSPLALRVR